MGTLALLGVAWVCLTPTPPRQPNFPGVDKWVHGVSYFLLALWFVQLRPQSRWQVIAALSAYGLLIEVLQGLGEVRHFEWADWAADSLGALLVLPVSRMVGSQFLLHFERWMKQG